MVVFMLIKTTVELRSDLTIILGLPLDQSYRVNFVYVTYSIIIFIKNLHDRHVNLTQC